MKETSFRTVFGTQKGRFWTLFTRTDLLVTNSSLKSYMTLKTRETDTPCTFDTTYMLC
jgi:hypothetical protein